MARLQPTGANIKSGALESAVHAASEHAPITIAHVLRAARSELVKLTSQSRGRGARPDR